MKYVSRKVVIDVNFKESSKQIFFFRFLVDRGSIYFRFPNETIMNSMNLLNKIPEVNSFNTEFFSEYRNSHSNKPIL